MVGRGQVGLPACVDDGISAAEFANRPGFLRLMNALKPRAPFHVLVMSEESRLGSPPAEQIDIAPGERAILIQTKASRLGMYLMGQTLFSADLLRRRFATAAIESVALCLQDDDILRPLLEAHVGCRVVVAPASVIAGRNGLTDWGYAQEQTST